MRLQKISTSYPTYLKQFYARTPGLAAQPYASQYEAFMNDCSGWADFWTVALSKLGVETNEVLANAEPLQRQWAAEQGTKFNDSTWFYDIVRSQIQSFRPDVLFLEDHAGFSAEFVRQLRIDCPFVRLFLVWCGAPYRNAEIFSVCDVVLSNISQTVQLLGDNGHRSYHLNHAFEPRILQKIDLAAPQSVDVAFFGSIVKKIKFHNARERFLVELVKNTNIEIWTDVYQPSAAQRRSTFMRQVAFDTVRSAQQMGVSDRLVSKIPVVNRIATWEGRPELVESLDPRLIRRAHPPVFGLAMFQQLHNTKIAINTHITASSDSASNMRLYEVTGVGCCLLTDEKKNLAELFEPGVEIVTYNGPEDCIEKIRYLQNHEQERSAIAAAGQKRTLKDHTFDTRSKQLCEILDECLRPRVR